MNACAMGRPIAASLAVALLPVLGGCHHPLAPSCREESGTVLQVTGDVPADGVATYVVVSPKNSNLSMRLTWPDASATLDMRATITDCGAHVGCLMTTVKPAFGPGGSSPVPQPWPPGLREMDVDGTKGKTYRVEVVGDPARAATFTLHVRYLITCES